MKSHLFAFLLITMLLAPTVVPSLSASTAYALRLSDILPIPDSGPKPMILPTPDYKVDVTNAIKSADKYIYAAFYYVEVFSSNTVIDELANAKERGVDVRLVVSNGALLTTPDLPEQLSQKGIPFHISPNHAKVVVIDDAVVYIGSANWNENGLENNWELTYRTGDAAAIAEAKGFVNTLWSTGKATVKRTAPLSEQPVNGPEYVDEVLNLIRNARSSIKFSMFEVVYDPKLPDSAPSKLLWELKKAYQRGVDVQIILDDPRYYEHVGGPNFLSKYNIPHKLDSQSSGPLERKHVKAFLIDDTTLVIGSNNWNWDSANSSQEYSIIVRDNAKINGQFKALFNSIWDVGIWKISP